MLRIVAAMVIVAMLSSAFAIISTVVVNVITPVAAVVVLPPAHDVVALSVALAGGWQILDPTRLDVLPIASCVLVESFRILPPVPVAFATIELAVVAIDAVLVECEPVVAAVVAVASSTVAVPVGVEHRLGLCP